MNGGWAVERATGSAAAFHAREVPTPARRSVWIHDVDAPALVLGSAQGDGTVDLDAAHAAGVEIVRRRSGGGAVLLAPSDVLWVDVIVPAGDAVWDDDVGRAAHWLGAVWVAALAACGGGASVHTGPLVRTPWSGVICFAGLGPGEVTRGAAKVVGISQRRTRHMARFQCAALARFDVDAIADLLAPPRPTTTERASLASAAAGVGVPLPDLEAAFLAALP